MRCPRRILLCGEAAPYPRRRAGLVLLVLLPFVTHAARAAEGDLDATFGPVPDGFTRVGFDLAGSTKTDVANAVAVGPDGSIVLAGSVATAGTTDNLDSALTKLEPDGHVDTGFGTNGKVTFDTDFAGTKDFLDAVGVQSNGNIVAAGETEYTGASVVKLSPSGVIIDQRVFHWGGEARFLALRVLPDDKILLAGFVWRSGNIAYLVMRLDPDLGRDPAFGSNGEVEVDFDLNTNGGYVTDAAYALTVDHHGRYVVCGSSDKGQYDEDMTVTRLLRNGTIDTTFGTNGRQVVPFDIGPSNYFIDRCQGVAVDTQDDVYLAGTVFNDGGTGFQTHAAVVKLRPDGSLDGSFNSNYGTARYILPTSGDLSNVAGAVMQSDDKLVLVGTGAHGPIGVARLVSSGYLDATFGASMGSVSYNVYFSGAADAGNAVTLQGGQILAAGSGQYSGADTDFAVARLQVALDFTDGFESGNTTAWSQKSP